MEWIHTNIGLMPLRDYSDLQAYKAGFNSYEEMRECGIVIGVNEDDIIYKDEKTAVT